MKQLDEIQRIIMETVSTQIVGTHVALFGGFRYRLLNRHFRRSQDLDLAADGDLDKVRDGVIEVLDGKVIPLLKRKGIVVDGHARISDRPGLLLGDLLRVIDFAAWDDTQRYAVPIDISGIPHLDEVEVRVHGGVMIPTLSDADMIEGKIVALLCRRDAEGRDYLDVFAFRHHLHPEARRRLSRRLADAGHPDAKAIGALLDRHRRLRLFHLRLIADVIDGFVDEPAATMLRERVGPARIFDEVIGLVEDLLLDGEDRS